MNGAAESSQEASGGGPARSRRGAALLAGGAVVAAALFLLFARSQWLQTLDLWRARLSAMAQDREAAVERWLEERREDANTTAAFPSVREAAALPDGAAGSAAAAHLDEIFSDMTLNGGYAAVALVDARGRVLAEGGACPLPEEALAAARRVLAVPRGPVQRFILTKGRPFVATVAPVPGAEGRAAVFLLSNPASWLYPFLASEAFPMATGACYLVDLEGGAVRLLSPLPGGPPVGSLLHDRASVRAARGEVRFDLIPGEGGGDVLAATRFLPGVRWGLVTRVGRWEAMAPYRWALGAGSFVLLAAVLLWVSFLYLYLRRRRLAELGRALRERERHERGLLRLNRLYRTLSRVNELLVREQDEGRLLDGLCRAAVEEGGYSLAWVGLKEGETGELRIVASAGDRTGYLEGARVRWDHAPEGRGPTGTAVREERTVVVNDWRNDPMTIPWRERGLAAGFGSGAVFPLRWGGRTAGALTLYDREAGAFTEERVRLGEELAADVGYAMGALGERRERERIEAREARLHRLWRTQALAQRAMVRASTVEELRQAVCRLLVEEGGLAMAWIALRQPGSFRFLPAASFGIAPQELEGIEVRWDDSPLGQGSMGTALKTGRPSLHQDLLSESRFSPWAGFMERHGFRSVASFPIAVRGEVEGVLAVYSGRPGAFFPEMVDLLEGLAQEAGFAEEALENRLKRASAEAELEESRRTFQTLAESAHAAIFVYRGEEFVYVNPEVCRLTRYEAGELLGRSVLSVVHPEDLPLVRSNLEARGRGTAAPPRYEFRVVAKGGEIRWIDFTAAACDFRGEKAVLCTAYDITERHRAEERLAESERRYRAFFERNVAGIYRSRVGAGLTECNPAFARLFGYDSPEEAVAQPVEAFYLDPADRAAFRERMMRERTVTNFEGRYRRKDGRPLWLLESAALVEDEAGGPPWIEGTCVDITERKAMEEELQRAKNLETVGMIAGGVAHEVRNPLFAITTIVTALQRKLADHPEFGEYVRHIVDQTGRLNALMTDLLTLGKPVEETAFVPVALQEVLRRCFELARKSAPGECPCTLELPEEPLDVMGKADQLVQVFLNLMQNAVSFTQPGGQVRVRAWREGARAIVTVSDEGPGIAEALLPRLFQPFQTGRKGGTGLGLAIVRKIVHAHHGLVEAVNNDPPPGSTFTVTLPLHGGA